jgi:hypothetical protein
MLDPHSTTEPFRPLDRKRIRGDYSIVRDGPATIDFGRSPFRLRKRLAPRDGMADDDETLHVDCGDTADRIGWCVVVVRLRCPSSN